MQTKAQARLLRLRAMARLVASARLNAGDALQLGRTGEATAWLECATFLEDVLRAQRTGGRVYLDVELRWYDEAANGSVAQPGF